MRLINGKGELISYPFTLVENLESYYAVVEVFSDVPFGDDLYKLDADNGSVDLVFEGASLVGNGYHAILRPKSIDDMLGKTYGPYYGESTVEDLVSSLGISDKFVSDYKTEKTFWSIPTCKLFNVVSILEKYTKVAEGGGVVYYFNLEGHLRMVDLKKAFSSISDSCLQVFGEVKTFGVSKEWNFVFPGSVDVVLYTTEGIKDPVNVLIEDGYGKGSLFVDVADENCVNLPAQVVTNEFYNKFYTAQYVTLDVLPNFIPIVGQPVKYVQNEVSEDYIIYGYRRSISSDTIQSLELKLVKCPN